MLAISGLRRSGTSMMMRMLEAAGIPCLYDYAILPDQFNPDGYYEFQPIWSGDYSCLTDPAGAGMAVKLNEFLPHVDPALGPGLSVIVMTRSISDVLDSFNALRAGRGLAPADPAYREFMAAELSNIRNWCMAHAASWIEVPYEVLIADPAGQCQRIASFLAPRVLNISAMAAIPKARSAL